MVNQTQLALNDAAEWLGDYHPLTEQLGSAAGLVTLASISSLLRLDPVHNVPTLRRFVAHYHREILLPVEWPVIRAAHDHADRNELRELVALDQHLSSQPLLQAFAAPSRRVGQGQLQKLRPLRDHRFVQRYLQAIDSAQAHGWHTLVYGVTLSVYSLPLRQGLLGYAHQTTRGFIYSASRLLRLSEHDCRGLFNEFCAWLPAALEQVLPVRIGTEPATAPVADQ